MVAGLDSGACVEHGVGVEEDARLAWRFEGQHDAGVAFDVAQLQVVAHVAADWLVAVQADPDDADLGATIGVDGGQVGQWSGVDQFPELVWQADHRRVPGSLGSAAMPGLVAPVVGPLANPRALDQLGALADRHEPGFGRLGDAGLFLDLYGSGVG